jgi:hypothetical protein
MTNDVKGRAYSNRFGYVLSIITIAICMVGCTSIDVISTKSNASIRPPKIGTAEYRKLSRSDLDHVIDARLSREDATSYLENIGIEDYSIQDPKTNWSHAAIGSMASNYSVYYLTYRQRHFIMLLAEGKDKRTHCIDVIRLSRQSSDYELGMGPVEINNDHYDREVVVIFNKNWKGDYSDEIIAAYKANLETKRIEEVSYKYIRIYREQ